MKRETTIKLAIWTILLAIIATPLSCERYFARKVEKNLEQNAIYCGLRNNSIWVPDWKINLPKIKNKDMDNNSKRESIFLYLDSEGNKVYQEITRTIDGCFELGEVKPYE